MVDGYILYLALLGGLVVLVLFGGLIRKLLKKADIEVSEDQMDLVSKALSDAVDKVEEINAKLEADGNRPMTGPEKKELIVTVAKDLAKAAGVSEIKMDLLLKMLDATIYKKSRQKKRAAMLRAHHKKKLAQQKAASRRAIKGRKRKGRGGL